MRNPFDSFRRGEREQIPEQGGEQRGESHARPRGGPRAPLLSRRPSARATAALAAGMLAIGVGVGAAIGPAPTASFAGATPAFISHLLAELASRDHSASATATTPTPASPAAETAPAPVPAAASPAAAASPSSSAPEPATQPSTPAAKTPAAAKSKLPAATSVWVIQLAGVSLEEALSQASSAPYITGQLVPGGTLLSSWSAIEGTALANEAALTAATSTAGTPPIVHSIVQPPCPEGAAGASCATPAGALAAADEFAKATLPTITGTPAYREHGLVVVTFASVGVATQQGLPAGASSATLTSQPAGGVLLASPFAKPGRSSVSFNAKAPVSTLEKLLR